MFYHGKPNKGKRARLEDIQSLYCGLVNTYAGLIDSAGFHEQLVLNDKKDTAVRAFEKANRPEGVNSAFCQNAFDDAFTHLSNRLDAIRIDMMSYLYDVFVQSKLLFAWCLEGKDQWDMFADILAVYRETGKEFYFTCAKEIGNLSREEFDTRMVVFSSLYNDAVLERKLPHFRNMDVRLDSRLMKLEASETTKAPYVISITDPLVKNRRITIPVRLSRDAERRLRQYKGASSVSFRVKGDDLKITRAFEKKVRQPAVSRTIGVDTGILDCFHASTGQAFGSMKEALGYYQGTVEPAFAHLSDMRNKKRNVSYYLRTHKLPEGVRKNLVAKMDRLERMIRKADAPYRKLRRYYQMLDKAVHDSVDRYISSITREDLTVLERLDIQEFKKSRKVNGMMSTFARGKLQQRLMQELNWRGFDFKEVEPAYTSQTCPVCSNLDKANRNGKTFTCTYCGYQDDADHVGSLCIRMRADDKELLKVCEAHKYNKDARHKAIRELYTSRHEAYVRIHPEAKAS